MKKFIDPMNRTHILKVRQYQVLKKQLPKITLKLQPHVWRTPMTVLN